MFWFPAAPNSKPANTCQVFPPEVQVPDLSKWLCGKDSAARGHWSWSSSCGSYCHRCHSCQHQKLPSTDGSSAVCQQWQSRNGLGWWSGRWCWKHPIGATAWRKELGFVASKHSNGQGLRDEHMPCQQTEGREVLKNILWYWKQGWQKLCVQMEKHWSIFVTKPGWPTSAWW